MEATKPYPPYPPRPCVLIGRVSLDVPRALAQAVATVLLIHRVRIGTRQGRRVLGCFAQAVLLLRFMRQRAAIADLARNNAVSLSTAYRYCTVPSTCSPTTPRRGRRGRRRPRRRPRPSAAGWHLDPHRPRPRQRSRI